MSGSPKLRKLMIVVEETGQLNSGNFNVYVSGDIERVHHIREVDMSAAEFWAMRFFKMCIKELEAKGINLHVPPEQERH